MKNSILRELFKRLAKAPETVANDYLKELSGQDRTDAERLIKALNIKTDYTATDRKEMKNKKTPRQTAGYRELYAIEHGNKQTIYIDGRKCYKYTYSKYDPYQDANGATFDTVLERWVD